MATTKKKTPAKKAPARKTSPKKDTSLVEEKITEKKVSPALKVKKSYVAAVLAVIVIAGLLYAFRSWFIVATVNGQPITRLTYINELERQAGQQTMNTLVTKTLIFQQANERNVTVTDQEINEEIKTIEENLKEQGQRLDQVLTLQGMTRDQLIEQIRLQKLIEKMVSDRVKVSDEEVTEYITANAESLPQDQDAEALQEMARERLEQQKLNQEIQTWLENLQKEATINYFIPVN